MFLNKKHDFYFKTFNFVYDSFGLFIHERSLKLPSKQFPDFQWPVFRKQNRAFPTVRFSCPKISDNRHSAVCRPVLQRLTFLD